MTIIDVMRDLNLFGPQFSGMSWDTWKACLGCAFALPLTPEQAAMASRCTGRQLLPTTQVGMLVIVAGRRGGKSFIASAVTTYLACCRDYSSILAPGEVPTIVLIASDRRQTRTLKRYIAGLLRTVPMLAAMIVGETADSIQLSNGVRIEIHTASFRSVRGYTIVAAILDEVAFWPTEDAANPDTEILQALRPAMATVPDAMLLMISTPYARRGELWKAYKEHYGKEHDPVLVWQADTRTMNPSVPQVVIDHAYADDPASAAAEYGAEFRKDIDVFIARDVVEACVIAHRRELPPIATILYQAFTDPAGGSGGDSFTVGIAHREGERVVLDCVREVRPPFSPEQVVSDFVTLLKSYRIMTVVGDRYAGQWPREQFRKQGIVYQVADKTKSELYKEFLPLLNSRSVDLLDHPRLISQLCGLERHTARGGKDSIDHGPHSHDDLINSAAGAIHLVKGGTRTPGIFVLDSITPSMPDEHLFTRLG